MVALDQLMTVQSKVSDYSKTLKPGVFQLEFIAELVTTRSRSSSKVRVILDNQKPTINVPGSLTVEPKQPLQVDIELDDPGSGLDRLAYGIVEDPNQVDEKTLTPLPLQGKGKQWFDKIEIQTANLELDPTKKYSAVFVCYDVAGNRQQTDVQLRVTAAKPVPVAGEGDIVGSVQGAEISWSVKIAGEGIAPKILKYKLDTAKDAGFDDRGFWVKNLKPGEYTVTAEGFRSGVKKTSVPVKVTVVAGQEKSVHIAEFEEPKPDKR
jgi:hypothetical protein